MPKVKVLIVEDEELYADQLEMHLHKLDYEHIATVDNSTDALIQAKKNLPDLILMDVNIHGEYDGIELSDLIQKHKITPVIFITSQADDMTFKRIKRTDPIGFLLKPFNHIQLQRTVELALGKLNEEQNEIISEEAESQDSFWVKNNNSYTKLELHEIIYLHAEGKYCTVYTSDSRYVLRKSLTKLLDKIDQTCFFQCHKSYAVNLNCVKSFDANLGIIRTDFHEVPLSRRMKEELKEKLDFL